MSKNLRLEDVEDLSFQVLTNNGVNDGAARILAGRVTAAERDGPASHGLAMLPFYVSSLSCDWVNGNAEPRC